MEFLKYLVLAVLLSGCSFLGGSVERYLAKTEATYVLPSGEKISYLSTKNQENFHAKIELDAEGKLKGLDVSTTAVTPEAAIAAFAAAQAKMAEALSAIVEKLSVLIPAAAKAGALAGS